MDELDKVQAVALQGAQAAQAVQALREQASAWGLALPPTPPFACDFGLGRFAEIGEVEVWIANEAVAGYCGKFLFVQDGQTCPLHCHRVKHETFYIVKGDVRMVCAGVTRVLHPGDVLPVAPGVRHAFTGIGPALLLEVSMPCVLDDNVFADERIPIGSNWRGRPPDATRG
jgi:mannose-6-phosphate isomerase-like protein (cupin superfamily)